jgi:hypothetical protein
MKWAATVAATVIGFMLVGTGGQAQSPGAGLGHVMVTPAELRWVAGPLPNVKQAVIEGNPAEPGPFTVRLLLPACTWVPPHWHPGIEHVTVLSGTFNVGMGEKFEPEMLAPKNLKKLPAGSFAVIPPKTPHFVWITEETIIQLHGVGPWSLTYVDPADDPGKK